MNGDFIRFLGPALMLAAAGLFAVVNALVKELMASLPLGQVIVWRMGGAFLTCWLLFAVVHGQILPPLRRPWLHAVRGALGVAALAALFLSFRYVPLGEATALYFSAPIFVVALSPLILSERAAPVSWASVGVGFAGMLLVIQPSTAQFNLASLIPAAASLLLAGSLLVSRLLSRTEPSLSIAFYFTAFSAVAVIPFGLTGWEPMPAGTLVMLALTGSLGGFAVALMTQAYRLSPAKTVAPLDYAGVLIAALIGFFHFGERLDAMAIVGMALIAVGGSAAIMLAGRGR